MIFIVYSEPDFFLRLAMMMSSIIQHESRFLFRLKMTFIVYPESHFYRDSG